MKVCFTSYRPFADSAVDTPLPESDPVNIAYALNGSYISFYSLKSLSNQQLHEKFRAYDLVIVALDVEHVDLVQRIVEASQGRAATYSEGHIADYQRLSPAGQVAFLNALNSASINFIYWEKYLSFYRTLTQAPVGYLPYPYLQDELCKHVVSSDRKLSRAALPSGLSGLTRNGLSSLVVAKQLLDAQLVAEVACWLAAESFEEDAQAISHFLFSTPFIQRSPALRSKLKHWLVVSRIDYRPLLKLVTRLRGKRHAVPVEALRIRNACLYQRSSWSKYIAQVASSRIMIDMNNRETVGRNALDCAALGIPCVSTDRSDLQQRLFPETTVTDAWDIDAAVQICERLLSDGVFYEQVTTQAMDALQDFGVEAFRKRFAELTQPLLSEGK